MVGAASLLAACHSLERRVKVTQHMDSHQPSWNRSSKAEDTTVCWMSLSLSLGSYSSMDNLDC